MIAQIDGCSARPPATGGVLTCVNAARAQSSLTGTNDVTRQSVEIGQTNVGNMQSCMFLCKMFIMHIQTNISRIILDII